MKGSRQELLRGTAERAIGYLAGLGERPVRPDPTADLTPLGGPLPEAPTGPDLVIELMDELVTPATMAIAGPRFFGWVMGGTLPVAVAADWLTTAWDQNALFAVATPGAVMLEATALRWIVEAAGLPEGTCGAFVTGTTVAHLTTLAAARTEVLAQVGWDVVNDGLFGAPPVTVVVGDEAHPSLIKALGIVGLGRERVLRVPVDGQGRMRPEALPRLETPAILCLQAGNVNTGAFDPMAEIIPAARDAGAWVHIDGAFGFWAALSPSLAPLAAGQDLADSWATDAHKYLNVPYDAGIALIRDPSALEQEMSVAASYLPEGEIGRDPLLYTPELSRRARGIPTWAVLKTLGRSGVAELVDRIVALARRFADQLEDAGLEKLNEVILNQVLVTFRDAQTTRRVIAAIQRKGTLYPGATTWQGRTAMRFSVCNWSTDEADIDRAVDAVLRCAPKRSTSPGTAS